MPFFSTSSIGVNRSAWERLPSRVSQLFAFQFVIGITLALLLVSRLRRSELRVITEVKLSFSSSMIVWGGGNARFPVFDGLQRPKRFDDTSDLSMLCMIESLICLTKSSGEVPMGITLKIAPRLLLL